MILPTRMAPLPRLLAVAAVLCLAGAVASFLISSVHAETDESASAPSNLTVELVDGQVSLNWDAPAEDAASVTGYEILRSPLNGEDTLGTLVADTGNANTAYVDATANESCVRYTYQVKAIRGVEERLVSNTAGLEYGSGEGPTPTEVAVTDVPIVVESTTAEYFVLYVRHELGRSVLLGLEADVTVEVPVLVKRGEANTTTLAESIASLPPERYRVEKYLIADPADVDGDCIDDITELADPVGMNPVNPASLTPAIEPGDGAVAVGDRGTWWRRGANQHSNRCGCGPAQQSCDRGAHHQRYSPGGRDPHGGHVGHRRRGRAGRRHLQLPVAGR